MRLICGPDRFEFSHESEIDALRVILYGQATSVRHASAGEALLTDIRRRNLAPAARAWDLLSIALSVITADLAGLRATSPDGWTREFELHIAVADAAFWREQANALTAALNFLTTDRWTLQFYDGGLLPPPPQSPTRPHDDCIMLLSGGLDSLIGGIDLVTSGKRPFAISQIVRGDAEKQIGFASYLGPGLNHLQLNHNAKPPGRQEASQRARSLIFITFGVLAATTLQRYYDGETIPLYVCENGFIAINPPLTGGRIGSLSTRTAHPEFLTRLQDILDTAGIRAKINNPYATKTKGEMLRECLDQTLLVREAVKSTSCGRFQRFNYQQCGRCIPCQVRRAALLSWGRVSDTTGYVYERLGKNDSDHAGFDDVRSVAVALAAVRADGFESWVGSALGSLSISGQSEFYTMLERGLIELAKLHQTYGVR